MGFRSNFITEHLPGIEVPDWFVEKYQDWSMQYSTYSNKKCFSIALLSERKFYDKLENTDVFKDIQKILIELNKDYALPLILLHECGGITKVHITQKRIIGMEPTAWKTVERVEHDYCYHCSEPESTS